MPKKRRKKSKMYFGQKTQDAIVEYNSMEPCPERDKIFHESIYFPIRKIAENLIHTYKFYYFPDGSEEVIDEVVANMVINMDKYNPEKGKAFSYFSVMAKNYLILNNNKNYKMGKIHDQIDVMDFNRNPSAENSLRDGKSFKLEVFEQMFEYWDNNLFKVFKKKKDIAVVDALLYLMKHNKNIENFNKKALYILIREMTDVETAHITSVVNVLKKHYKKLQNLYHKQGSIIHNHSGSFF